MPDHDRIAPEHDSGPPVRLHQVDNARGILVILVVLVHLVTAIGGWQNMVLKWPYVVIALFVIPSFVFLTGHMARTDRLAQRIGGLVVLLLTFQALYYTSAAVRGLPFSHDRLRPYWMLWFILSMIWWLAFLPVARRIPFILPTSIVVALVAGMACQIDHSLSASRTLVFFPFFIAGALYGKPLLARLQATDWRRIPVAMLGLAALAAIFMLNGLDARWLDQAAGYAARAVSDVRGILIRACLLVMSGAASAIFLWSIPVRRSMLAVIGKNSLGVFLLHGFIVKIVALWLPALHRRTGTILLLVLLVALSIAIAVVLGRDGINHALRRFAATPGRWLAGARSGHPVG